LRAKTTFAESHDGRPLSYGAGRVIHHTLGHDLRLERFDMQSGIFESAYEQNPPVFDSDRAVKSASA